MKINKIDFGKTLVSHILSLIAQYINLCKVTPFLISAHKFQLISVVFTLIKSVYSKPIRSGLCCTLLNHFESVCV